MDRNKIIKKIFNIALPFILSGAILWWMYRYTDFKEIEHTVMHEMNWGWMLFSLVFGVTAQLFRGIRWKQTLAPMNEHPRTTHPALSYLAAANLCVAAYSADTTAPLSSNHSAQ